MEPRSGWKTCSWNEAGSRAGNGIGRPPGLPPQLRRPSDKRRCSWKPIDASGSRKPSSSSDSPGRSLVHLRRSRARNGQQPPSSAKLTRSSSAPTMNGRPWSATGCRMACSICCGPPNSIPRSIEARVDLVNLCVAQGFYGYMSPTVAADIVRRTAELRLRHMSVPRRSDSARARLGPVPCRPQSARGALRLFALRPSAPRPVDHPRRAMFALSRHRFGEAIDLLRAAIQLDPYSPGSMPASPGRCTWPADAAATASTRSDSALSQFPENDGANLYGAIILAYNGETARATSNSPRHSRSGSPTSIWPPRSTPMPWPVPDRADEARAILERLQWLGRERFLLEPSRPAVYVALGEPDAALAELRTLQRDPLPVVLPDARRSAPQAPPEPAGVPSDAAPSSPAWKLKRASAGAAMNRTLILPAHPVKVPSL